jgi:hypothetical protein
MFADVWIQSTASLLIIMQELEAKLLLGCW